jgi:S-(hydroxymethyl)glutathione dehydrogenase/alcohol dehydrogenase
MKAAVLKELNAPLSIENVNLTELQVGQVQVRVLVSGICGSQLHEINGNKGNGKFLPHLMGHEGCGIVEDIGPGVTTVKVGDKVVMHWRPGTGIEAAFPQYTLGGKTFSSGKVNTLTQWAIVSENRLTTVPSETPNDLAALLGCSLTTALGIIDNECDFKFGESVAVVGTGGVGLNLIQGAAMRSLSPIVAIDNNESKRDLSFIAGADFFYNTSETEFEGKVDVVIDKTGNVDVIKKSFGYLSNNGRMILVGQPKPGTSLEIINALSFFNGNGLSIKATQGGKTDPSSDILRYVKLEKAGKLYIDEFITHRYKLDEVNEAFDMLRSGTAGRIMIDME